MAERSRLLADMKPSAKGQPKKKVDMKIKIIVAILLILNYCTVFGQKNVEFPSYEKFYSTFIEHLKYPSELQNKCVPTITLMKVTFTNTGELDFINFSDSATPEFVDLIQNIKNKLDFKSIYTDLRSKKKDINPVLIPIQIDFEKIGECTSTISSGNLQKLYRFSGKPMAGEYFMYPDIYCKYTVGRKNE